jgi:gamma-glutamyl-gamma-aminobutyrate hydrolase PuuD
MQAIVLYSRLYDECVKSGVEPTTTNIFNKYGELRKEGVNFLDKLEGHGGELSRREQPVYMENLIKFKHNVNIKENSILFDIYKKKTINVFSLHSYGFHEVVDTLEVMAKSSDNVVEAVKYKNKPIIGVQFHIDLDETSELFENFLKKCKN